MMGPHSERTVQAGARCEELEQRMLLGEEGAPPVTPTFLQELRAAHDAALHLKWDLKLARENTAEMRSLAAKAEEEMVEVRGQYKQQRGVLNALIKQADEQASAWR